MNRLKTLLAASTIVLAVIAAIATHLIGPGSAVNVSLAQQADSRDYLSVELREKVQQLKSDLASQPSNADNAPERAMVLYKWANAFSLKGGVIPVNLTSLISRFTGYRATNPPVAEIAGPIHSRIATTRGAANGNRHIEFGCRRAVHARQLRHSRADVPVRRHTDAPGRRFFRRATFHVEPWNVSNDRSIRR